MVVGDVKTRGELSVFVVVWGSANLVGWHLIFGGDPIK